MPASVNKILVVDDEAVIRELLSDILDDEGFEVDSADGGPAALRLLKEQDDFVVLFTDIMMPEMDGIQLVREARKIRPDIIPIVMTGFATLETARAAVKEGAYDYVLKPFSLSEVKLAVNNALERHDLINENARLRQLTDVFDVSETIARIRDEKELLNYVMTAAVEHAEADCGSIMLMLEDGETLKVAAAFGLPQEARMVTVPLGQGISGWVAQNVQPLLYSDLKNNPELAALGENVKDGSFVSVPLERKNVSDGALHAEQGGRASVLAVLNVSRRNTDRQFTEGDMTMLNIIANHAAAAIQNIERAQEIERDHLQTIEWFTGLLEARGIISHGQDKHVAEVALKLARRLSLPDTDIAALRLASGIYDVGKVGISDAILQKDGPLSDSEWDLIRHHPVLGCDIVKSIRRLKAEHLEIVRSHHERFDGSGYPDGLQGDEIPMLVRIMTAADAYCAMASPRAYRDALDKEQIAAEFERGKGKQFDPEVADHLIILIQTGALVA